MIKQNPFSIYDFLGYLIPGALLIYLYIFIEYLETLNDKFDLSSFLKLNSEFQIEKVLFFVILSYSLGHLLNFTSSITIEKYANWKYDYPSKYLLGFDKKGVIKTLNIKRFILAIILFPVTVLDLILGDLFKFKEFYTRKLDDFLVETISKKGLILINKLLENIELDNKIKGLKNYDFFRIFSHYTFEHSKNHQFRLVNYVVLYGFLRTMTLISIIIFWYFVYIMTNQINGLVNYFLLIIIGLISYAFFMAFMKFYRRYTLEGLMLIAIDKELIETEE